MQSSCRFRKPRLSPVAQPLRRAHVQARAPLNSKRTPSTFIEDHHATPSCSPGDAGRVHARPARRPTTQDHHGRRLRARRAVHGVLHESIGHRRLREPQLDDRRPLLVSRSDPRGRRVPARQSGARHQGARLQPREARRRPLGGVGRALYRRLPALLFHRAVERRSHGVVRRRPPPLQLRRRRQQMHRRGRGDGTRHGPRRTRVRTRRAGRQRPPTREHVARRQAWRVHP